MPDRPVFERGEIEPMIAAPPPLGPGRARCRRLSASPFDRWQGRGQLVL